MKNNYWTFLLSQIHDVCDAIITEISVMTGNRLVPARSPEATRSREATKNRSVNADIAKEISATPPATSSSTASPSKGLKKEMSATLSNIKASAPRKKRISDISQLRLDAYVARSTEQDEKKKRIG